jgi:hypothetical protein
MRTKNFSICMIKVDWKGIKKWPRSKVQTTQKIVDEHRSAQQAWRDTGEANSTPNFQQKRSTYQVKAAVQEWSRFKSATFRRTMAQRSYLLPPDGPHKDTRLSSTEQKRQ